jgi:hypothetical protein
MTSIWLQPAFFAALATLLTACTALIKTLQAGVVAQDTNAKVTAHGAVIAGTALNVESVRLQTNGTAAALQARIDEMEQTIKDMRELGLTPKTVPLCLYHPMPGGKRAEDPPLTPSDKPAATS